MTRDKIVKEKYFAVFNSAVADKNRRIAEIKTPQKLPAIRYFQILENEIQTLENEFQILENESQNIRNVI